MMRRFIRGCSWWLPLASLAISGCSRIEPTLDEQLHEVEIDPAPSPAPVIRPALSVPVEGTAGRVLDIEVEGEEMTVSVRYEGGQGESFRSENTFDLDGGHLCLKTSQARLSLATSRPPTFIVTTNPYALSMAGHASGSEVTLMRLEKDDYVPVRALNFNDLVDSKVASNANRAVAMILVQDHNLRFLMWEKDSPDRLVGLDSQAYISSYAMDADIRGARTLCSWPRGSVAVLAFAGDSVVAMPTTVRVETVSCLCMPSGDLVVAQTHGGQIQAFYRPLSGAWSRKPPISGSFQMIREFGGRVWMFRTEENRLVIEELEL